MDDLDGPPIQEHSLAGQKRKRPDQAVPPGGAKLVGIHNLLLVDYNEVTKLTEYLDSSQKHLISAWSNTIQPEWWGLPKLMGDWTGERVKLRGSHDDRYYHLVI